MGKTRDKILDWLTATVGGGLMIGTLLTLRKSTEEFDDALSHRGEAATDKEKADEKRPIDLPPPDDKIERAVEKLVQDATAHLLQDAGASDSSFAGKVERSDAGQDSGKGR